MYAVGRPLELPPEGSNVPIKVWTVALLCRAGSLPKWKKAFLMLPHGEVFS